MIHDQVSHKCMQCKCFRVTCAGRNVVEERLSDLCALIRGLKRITGKTNAMIAFEAGVSQNSVDNISAGKINDIRFSTVQAILRVLLPEFGRDFCELEVGDKSFMLDQIKVKDKEIAAQRKEIVGLQRRSMFLVVFVIALLLAIITALVVDAMSPDLGFFWRQ